jgi:hypothetical protein
MCYYPTAGQQHGIVAHPIIAVELIQAIQAVQRLDRTTGKGVVSSRREGMSQGGAGRKHFVWLQAVAPMAHVP